MSLENIVIAVSLLLGIVLLILIIYLISRVNDLEAKAFSFQSATSSEKKTETDSQKVFGGLNGRQLWDEWVAMANGGEDRFGIRGDRDRFLALLELHIRSLIKTGIEHGSNGINEPPSNPLKIKMLRGEFESYLPSSQAGRLYEIGCDLGVSDDPQQQAALVAALTETVDAISMGIDAGSTFVENAMRDVSTEPQDRELGQELVPADQSSVD
mgnify:FL=1